MSLFRNGYRWTKSARLSLVALLQHGPRPYQWLPIKKHLRHTTVVWLLRNGLIRLGARGLLHVTPAGLFAVKLTGADAAFFDQYKRDPRDKLIRIGGFHGGHYDVRFVVFLPHDAYEPKNAQGNGDPLPKYAVQFLGCGVSKTAFYQEVK